MMGVNMDGHAWNPLDDRDRIALAGTYNNLISRWWALVPRPGRESNPTDPGGARRIKMFWRIRDVKQRIVSNEKEPRCPHREAPARPTVRFDAPHQANPSPRRFLSLSRL